MRNDSDLDRLAKDFSTWRKGKKHPREQIPESLMEKARRAIPIHGVSRVASTLGVEHSRLKGNQPKKTSAELAIIPRKTVQVPMPTYSRIELSRPMPTVFPIAEVENPMGVKLRVFALTPETASLLSALVGMGRMP